MSLIFMLSAATATADKERFSAAKSPRLKGLVIMLRLPVLGEHHV
jgi:hypothetical protein